MLEYPEMYTIAEQMKKVLVGKTVIKGEIVKTNTNLFISENENQRYPLLYNGKVTDIDFCAPEIYICLDNGYGIIICQGGGKIFYNNPDEKLPEKYNIRFDFDDGSNLTYLMLLWSYGIFAMSNKDWQRRKENNIRTQYQPLSDDTFDDYMNFIEAKKSREKIPIKVFMSKYIAGVMSAYSAEILLYAGVFPEIPLGKINRDEHKRIYESIKKVLTSACEKGGKNSAYNLYKQKGNYPIMSERRNLRKPCPICGKPLEKTSVGGVTTYCSNCQVKHN